MTIYCKSLKCDNYVKVSIKKVLTLINYNL